jgi:alkyl sulfatase BDS1-like metallo-beta-lactamase superfamily hydrolase
MTAIIRLLAVVLTLFVTACEAPREAEPEPAAVEGDANPKLVAHTEEFERKVYTVTEGVYQAVGFGVANSIMVEGDECVFIVDVMGSMETAKEVKAEFDKITQKPVGALIYTHNHADHVMGGLGFVPDGKVDAYAHDTTNYYINRVASVIRPALNRRSTRMFGNYLPEQGPDRMVNVGLGPFLETLERDATIGLIRPNKTFSTELDTEICGVKVKLVHAPGETNDQLFVWLPERGVLMPGDNVYKAFPNLYTIRGTLYRDVLGWAQSIDKMRALRPTHLAPSHTRPVSGQAEVAEILTAYRDGIQFVHDQTLRGMNQGLTPDELVELVQLPPHLKDHPFLQEYYGTVAWSVRSVFSGYLGWFDGDAASLEPASPDDRAAGMASLAGGAEGLQKAAQEALDKEQYAWAAELGTYLMRLDPDSTQAKQIRADALRALGQRHISANGRNYYITQALEAEGKVRIHDDTNPENALSFVNTVPIGQFVSAMPANLDAAKSADKEMVVGFRFPDVDEAYGIEVRRGVAEFLGEFPNDPDVTITADTFVWRELVLGLRNPVKAFASGDVKFDGSALDLVAFLRLFQPPKG